MRRWLIVGLMVGLLATTEPWSHSNVALAAGTADKDGRLQVSAAQWMGGYAYSGPACSWHLVDGNAVGGNYSLLHKTEGGVSYTLWYRTCGDAGVEVWVADISTDDLVKFNYKKLVDQIVEITPSFAPPLKPQYKGHPTHIWFAADQLKHYELTASVPGISVTLVADSANVVFNSGSTAGDYDCRNVPKALGDCDFTYTETSKDAPDLQFEGGVTVHWNVSYTTNGRGRTELKPVDKKTPIRIMVAKIQTISGAAP